MYLTTKIEELENKLPIEMEEQRKKGNTLSNTPKITNEFDIASAKNNKNGRMLQVSICQEKRRKLSGRHFIICK